MLARIAKTSMPISTAEDVSRSKIPVPVVPCPAETDVSDVVDRGVEGAGVADVPEFWGAEGRVDWAEPVPVVEEPERPV